MTRIFDSQQYKTTKTGFKVGASIGPTLPTEISGMLNRWESVTNETGTKLVYFLSP